MTTWLEDHLDEVVARFAAEDETTPNIWRERAVYATASRRMQGSMATQGFGYCDDWMAAAAPTTEASR